MRFTFGQKIALAICTLVVGLLGAVVTLSNVWIERAIEGRLSKDLAAADETFAEILRLRSQELTVQTRMLADVPQLRAVVDTPDLDHTTLLDSARMARQLVGSDLLMLVDDKGRVLASASEPERHGESAAANPAVATALAGEPFEGMIVSDDGIYQIVASPIMFGGEVAGAVVTGFAVGEALLATLEEMTNAYVALWAGSITQVSDRGRSIFDVLAPRLVAKPGAIATIATDSDRYLLRVGQIGDTAVSYALVRSLESELGFYRELRSRLLLTGVVILVVALISGLLYSRRITRPIEALAAGTLRLAEGDLGSRVHVDSHDEIGQLAAAFNRMAAEIQSRIEEERRLAASKAKLNAELAKVNEDLTLEISEREQAEREVKRLNEELEARVARRTAELEALNRQLEAFSYSVSHDLRGPLRTLAGFSQTLAEEAAARLTEQDQSYLRRIQNAAIRMGEMIEHLLEFSRVARGQLVREPVDLTALANGVVDDLRAGDPERRVEVVIAPDLKVDGDAALLRAALQNLLSNAWKFTSRSEHARVELGTEAGNGLGPVFFVRDNGAGFDMAHADKLFRVFERLHSKDDYEGHGIGLATVRRIIEHHGGRIWAESAPAAGATFRFTLG